MKKLPIGKQDFATLIRDNYIYVDKTEIIYNLINTGSAYFYSRPRRFGKSLTVSTLKEIFSGNKEVFKGLWIYDKIDWKKYPVIHISFAKTGFKTLGLERATNRILNKIGEKNDILLHEDDCGLRFEELIGKLAETEQVVILIDEYDKPIIDYIEEIPKAEENREKLKNFYSILKDNDQNIKFLFITGVSKFSKVSIFSDLNHLDDITLNKNYATLTGYSEQEIDYYFSEYLQSAGEELKEYTSDIRHAIKNWYNGYSWDGKNFVYNPFSMLNFFSSPRFDNFWFKTGTPTFLMKLIKENNYTAMEISGNISNISAFDKYELTNMKLMPLLFQTGYVTIKKLNPFSGEIVLDYPNKEVQNSFENYLLSTFSEHALSDNPKFLHDIIRSLQSNDIDKFIHLLKILFKGITYPLIDDKENYYHSIFYLVIKLLGFDIETELLTIDGRIDTVIKMEKRIYIIEFKLGTAQEVLDQIKKKQYHLKYEGDKKELVLLGIGFDVEKKNIGEYLIETMK